jgi:hypothetical protein
VEPYEVLMAARVSHHGKCHDWRSAHKISDSICTPCFILDVEVDILRVCGPLLMVVIQQFSLCLHELQWLMMFLNGHLLPKIVMSPLVVGFHNGVHFFVIIRVLMDII